VCDLSPLRIGRSSDDGFSFVTECRVEQREAVREMGYDLTVPVRSSKSKEKDDHDPHIDWIRYVAGAGSGFLQVAVPYPIHKLMFRQVTDEGQGQVGNN